MKKKFIKVIKKLYFYKYKIKYNINYQFLTDSFFKEYKNCKSVKEFFRIHKVHKKGFKLSDWNLLELNENNYKDYISTAKYYSLHKLDDEFSSWIDDKLTLKYICSGTKLDKYMPKYFAQIDENGIIHKLMDYPKNEDENLILKPEQIAELVNSLGGGNL